MRLQVGCGRVRLAALALIALVAGCDRPQAPAAAAGDVAGADPHRPPLFRDVAAETGLRFQHFLGSVGDFRMPETMAAGAALLDYDGDGDLDLFLLQGSMLKPGEVPADAVLPPPQDFVPGHRLYRNLLVEEGRLFFEDVSAVSGVGLIAYGQGVAVGDYDNDGDPDLYITHFGPNALLRNDGNGRFTDVTVSAGVGEPRWSTSAAFLDYDGDRDLDLFVTNYLDFSLAGHRPCSNPAGRPDYCAPEAYSPLPDRLYRNDGNGRFRDVTAEAGLEAAFGSGLGVATADFDGDGLIDIYVANDRNANQMWLNQGDGRFADGALLGGSAYNADGRAEASMGVTAGDFDNDGDEDLFMTHLRTETHTLYVNDGAGNFSDLTARFNLARSSLPHTGFGTAWLDYDQDGFLDLFVANGDVIVMEDQIGQLSYPYAQRNALFRNLDGTRFEDVSATAGAALTLLECSRGAAFGDLDNDGDVDIVVHNAGGPARLLLNEAGAERSWLTVALVGTASNRDALGARVALLRPGRATLWRRVHRDGSYASANDPRVHFGLGDGAGPVDVGVVWPAGGREIWRGVAPDRLLELREGEGEAWKS